MFDTDDVDEAKRMLPIYKRAVDFLETVSGKKTEQAEQEPLAVVGFDTKGWRNLVDALTKLPDGQPLYTHPVRTKDLTDDEIFEILELQNCPKSELKYWFHDARAVIAAYKEKNK